MSYDLYVSPTDAVTPADWARARREVGSIPGCRPRRPLKLTFQATAPGEDVELGDSFIVQPEDVAIDLTDGDHPRITLSAARPVIHSAGPRALTVALELAKRLGWNLYDPQLGAAIGHGDIERVYAQQRAWAAVVDQIISGLDGKSQPTSDATHGTSAPPFPTGWVEEDGWWIPPYGSRAERLRILNETPPRRYGWRDQVKADARAIHALLGWTAAFSALIAGGIWRKWYLLAFGLLWVGIFGPTFRRLIRLVRDGRVLVIRATNLNPIPLVKSQGSIEFEISSGRKLTVMVPLEPTQSLIARDGAVEVQVLALDGVQETSLVGIRSVKRL